MTKLPFLLNEEKLSEWAYIYCKDINDDPEVRKYITNSFWAYRYCIFNNDPEVRKNITESRWAYVYCKNINDDPKIGKNITDSRWAYRYCSEINDDPEVRKYIKNLYLLKDLYNDK